MLKLILWTSLLLVSAVVLVFGLAFIKLQLGWAWLPSLSYATAFVVVMGVDYTRRVVLG